VDRGEHRRRRRDDAGATETACRDALVWSPQWLRIAEQVHISTRETYDASATPTQRAKSIRPKVLAQADLEQLGETIKATLEKAKADDRGNYDVRSLN